MLLFFGRKLVVFIACHLTITASDSVARTLKLPHNGAVGSIDRLGDQSSKGSAFRFRVGMGPLFDQELAAPVGWVGIENRLRKRPRMFPWVDECALTFAIHLIRGFNENSRASSLSTLEEFVDVGHTEHNGVRSGTLKCRRSGLGVCAGRGDDDGTVLVHKLTAAVADAQTFDQWKSRGEPLNRFAHFRIITN